MKPRKLYRGAWPSVVGKAAKYSIRMVDGDWRVTILYETGEGERYLAVDTGQGNLPDLIQSVKDPPSGVFYINEYRHVIVPMPHGDPDGTSVHYHYVGKFRDGFTFTYEDRPLSTKAVDAEGRPLEPGDQWFGPRPGIPYALAAGGQDIYHEMPALTDDVNPRVKPRTTKKVKLSKALRDPERVRRACAPVVKVRGYSGGRFYVNENGVIFTPTTSDFGEIDYIFCGHIDLENWFPEPPVP